MAVPYATQADVKDLCNIAHDDIDKFVAKFPGRLEKMSQAVSGKLDMRLRVRYGVPFPSPYPYEIVALVVAILVWELVLAKGINPTTEQSKELKAKHDDAWDTAEKLRTNEYQLDPSVDATPSKSEGGPVIRHIPDGKDYLYGGRYRSLGCGRC